MKIRIGQTSVYFKESIPSRRCSEGVERVGKSKTEYERERVNPWYLVR